MDRLTELQIFIRVVETGSFSRAARDLTLSQPTVTKHINSFESRLKARLLNRNPRAVSLTEIGAQYFEKCKGIVHDYDEAQAIVLGRRAHVEGLIRVGTSLTFGRRIVAPLLVEFMRAHPDLHVDVKRRPVRGSGRTGYRRRDPPRRARGLVAWRSLPGFESLGHGRVARLFVTARRTEDTRRSGASCLPYL